MPRKPEWTHRIAAAIGALESLNAHSIDRTAIERLFDVSPRQALRILAQFSPGLVGKSFAVERTSLIAALRAWQGRQPVEAERVRRVRVSEEIEALRRQQRSRTMAIRPAAAAESAPLGMPPGLAFRPGKLEVDYASPEDLLAKLLTLARAVAADPEGFCDALSQVEPGP